MSDTSCRAYPARTNDSYKARPVRPPTLTASSSPVQQVPSTHTSSCRFLCLLGLLFHTFITMRAVGFTPLVSLVSFFSLSSAGKVPFGSLASGSSSTNSDHPVSVARAQGSTGFHYSHAANDEYTATIYVNGVPYQVRDPAATFSTRTYICDRFTVQVILDTGSSDTWIDPLSQGVSEPSDLFHTGFNSSTTYV